LTDHARGARGSVATDNWSKNEMFKLEIDTSSEMFDPDFDYEVARLLDDIRRRVNGLQAGFGSIGGRIPDRTGATVGRWEATDFRRGKG
jgi:hypothetical protein